MKLTEKQRDIIIQKLTGVVKCPMCNSHQFTISDAIFEMREFNGGDLVIGGAAGAVLPLVTLVCATCGHTLSFNAITLGIVSQGVGGKDATK